MSVLSKIRNIQSIFKTEWMLVLLGFVLILSGLLFLFIAPSEFLLRQNTITGNVGTIPVPEILTAILGWVLFSFGILNQINFSNFEQSNNPLNQFSKRIELEVKTIIFYISTFLFVLITISIFLTIRPDKINKAKNEEFYKGVVIN